MSNEPKPYELPTGSIAILADLLPTAGWYAGDPKPITTVTRASEAIDALPETAPRPTGEASDEELDAWAGAVLMFQWTDAQKAAAAKCIRWHAKAGAFFVNPWTTAIFRFLQLDDE